MTAQSLSRRELVRRAAAAAGAAAVPAFVPAAARGSGRLQPPSERINVGVIGLGAMGRGHVNVALGHPGMQLMAVCDVDRERRETCRQQADAHYAAARAAGAYKGCTAYNDYREMLARPDIDGVLIATPDHWHALQSVDAAKAGKDVYCEKPITMTIGEGMRLVQVMRDYGCIFQTGTQYRSTPTTRRVTEFVREGGLGKLKQVFTIFSRVEDGYVPSSRALPAEPVPAGLDWDLWVGPAPWRPYNRAFHRNPIPGVVPWAFCEDFGVANITWHHSHSADIAQYGIGSERTGPVEVIHPSSGRFPTLTFRYADGVLLHLVDDWWQTKSLYRAVPESARIEGSFGALFVGERGWVTTMYPGPVQGAPESLFAEMGMRNRQVPGGNNHHGNWLDCIRTRGRTSTDEVLGHRTASIGHLAHIGYKVGRSLKWDPAAERFVGSPDADRLRTRAMREPWRM